MKGAHEAIVSEELWDRCQEETKRRAKTHSWMTPEEKPPVRIRRSSHPLYGKLYCTECGSPMERVTAGRKGKEKKMWRCKRNNGECHNHYIDESKIMETIGELNLLLVERINIGHDGEIDIVMVKRYNPLVFVDSISISFSPLSLFGKTEVPMVS